MSNHYQTLGLTPDADPAVIKAAYRALCKLYHPDIYNGDVDFATDMMQKINGAYEVLSDAQKRSEYDREWGESESYSSAQSTESKYKDNSIVEEDWNFAVQYYPKLNGLFGELSRISPALAYSFKAVVVEEKKYDNSEVLAASLENGYLEKYFGSNRDIKKAAKEYILNGQRDAAYELNKAVNVFGSDINAKLVLEKVSNIFQDRDSKNESAENLKGKFKYRELDVIVVGVFVFFFLLYLMLDIS